MQKKSFIILCILLSVVAGCNKAHKTTGIITQETDSPESQRMAQLRQMAETDPAAAYDMGLRYLKGDGVEQNSYQAIETFRAAAAKGDRGAQAALGKIYLSGMEEMGADMQEAEKWLTLAAGQGDAESKKLLAQLKKEKKKRRDSWSSFYRYDWYYHAPYRLYWYHSAWRYY